MKVGLTWVIPADVEEPDDERIKSGKYINEMSTAVDSKLLNSQS